MVSMVSRSLFYPRAVYQPQFTGLAARDLLSDHALRREGRQQVVRMAARAAALLSWLKLQT